MTPAPKKPLAIALDTAALVLDAVGAGTATERADLLAGAAAVRRRGDRPVGPVYGRAGQSGYT